MNHAREQFDRDLVAILPQMMARAITLTRDRVAAADLVQQTAVKALRAWEQFAPGTTFGAWMHRILTNEFLTNIRKRKRSPVSMDAADLETMACRQPLQDVLLDAAETRRMIDLLIPEHKHAIMRCCVEEWSYEEAAAEIGADVGTIKSRIFRAREQLSILMGAA